MEKKKEQVADRVGINQTDRKHVLFAVARLAERKVKLRVLELCLAGLISGAAVQKLVAEQECLQELHIHS